MSWRILKFLKEGATVSGEEISAGLGISRAAVWKKITLLRKKGYVIQAVPSRGYLLVASPDLAVEQIITQIQGNLWKTVLYYPSVDSTNDLAASMRDILPGTVIIADSQTRGRGRLGRSWISPPGRNIYLSMIIRPELLPRDAPLLTVLTAVSCAHALRCLSGLPLSIKWPNDLTAQGKKIGGILTETRSDPDHIQQAVIGVGVNVNMSMDDIPDDLRETATSLVLETGRYFQRTALIVGMLSEFERQYKILLGEGKESLLADLRALSSTIGRDVVVTAGNERLAGHAEEIDDDGVLILRLASGERRRVSAGDLHMTR
ncbi:MAG: biotin--[acetyl-CoA-carboxylase] ligase [Nitrospiraceae bacterium]|nr:biotin--[acetyl-CoA-carboxylase] ligase [Nitrospiraceae bacterium]